MARFFALLAAAAMMLQGALAMPHYYPMPNATYPEQPQPYPTGTSVPLPTGYPVMKERALREAPIDLPRH